MFENIDNKNSLIYAAHVYDNPACMTKEEFTEDYKRLKYVKRLCRRYSVLTSKKTAKVEDFGSERLLLNHIIMLGNVFGVEPTVRLLFLKCDDERLWKVLKPFLWHLKYLPRLVRGINGKLVKTDDIPMDDRLLGRIRELCSNDSNRG